MGKLRAFWSRHGFPLTVFFVSRLGLILLAYMALSLLPVNDFLAHVGTHFPDNHILQPWARYDSGYYNSIAIAGYKVPVKPGKPSNTAFFPLYPVAIRALTVITGHHATSGWIISQVSTGLMMVLLYDMLLVQYGKRVTKWSVVLMMVQPFSLYFSAVYSEALFTLCAVAAFYFGEKRKWWWAGVCAGFASAARGVGLIVSLGILVQYLDSKHFKLRNVGWDILWLSLGATGVGSYMFFLWRKFGDPLLFIKARQVIGWSKTNNWSYFADVLRQALTPANWIPGTFPILVVLNIGMAVMTVAVVLVAWKRLRVAHAAWALVMVVVSFAMAWQGMGRFVLPVFPGMVAWPLLVKRDDVLVGMTYVSTLLLALCTVMFNLLYWVA